MESGTVALTTFTGSSIVAHTVGSVSVGETVTPHNTHAGDVSLYDITLTTSATIPIGGKIRVTFPTGFSVATTAMTYPVGIDSSSTVAYSGNVVTITIVGTAITPVPLQTVVISFTLNGITNPGIHHNLHYELCHDQLLAAGTSGMYVLTTLNAVGSTINTWSLLGSTFSVQPITGANVVPRSSNAGDTGYVDVTLPLTVDVPIGGRFQVLFPNGFTAASTAVSSVNGIDASSTVSVSGNTVTITIAGTAITAGSISFALDGITNPGTQYLLIQLAY